VTAVAFSPDGKQLAAGASDQTIRRWDVTTRRPIGAPLTGHTGGVAAVAFSPDGRLLASGGRDETVRLWDVATQRPLGPSLTGYFGSVTALTFSRDGTTLTAGGGRLSARWDVRVPADLYSSVCAFVGSSLTRTEWERYAPGEEFEPACR
jgi:WD40 repeat protein